MADLLLAATGAAAAATAAAAVAAAAPVDEEGLDDERLRVQRHLRSGVLHREDQGAQHGK